MNLYRIYVEDDPKIPEIVSRFFDSFTFIPAEGWWKGKRENSAIVEILTTRGDSKVIELAQTLRVELEQEAVLIITRSVGTKVVCA